MNNYPAGIFDSGVGGLSVWQEIDRRLPNESIVYYADNANCPYGDKTQAEVSAFSENAVRFLLSKQCKLIVIACNTATSMAIDLLRTKFEIPIIGIVPAIKPAATNSKTGVIAILATTGTLQSRKFNETREKFSGNTEVIPVEANDLVEIVERGLQNTPQAEAALRRHIDPLLERNIDHLVLGCTHFPFLIDDIRKITGNSVILENPAAAIAKRTEYILQKEKICASPDNKKQVEFYASGNIDLLQQFQLRIAEKSF